MKRTITGILTNYFNVGEGKRANTAWLGELKALTDDEKRELAEAVCAETGWTIEEK